MAYVASAARLGVVRVIGVLLIAAGLPLLLDSFARFAI
jgi:hypothetical protein